MDAVLQFIFHADPHVEPMLALFKCSRIRNHPLVHTNREAVSEGQRLQMAYFNHSKVSPCRQGRFKLGV